MRVAYRLGRERHPLPAVTRSSPALSGRMQRLRLLTANEFGQPDRDLQLRPAWSQYIDVAMASCSRGRSLPCGERSDSSSSQLSASRSKSHTTSVRPREQLECDCVAPRSPVRPAPGPGRSASLTSVVEFEAASSPRAGSRRSRRRTRPSLDSSDADDDEVPRPGRSSLAGHARVRPSDGGSSRDTSVRGEARMRPRRARHADPRLPSAWHGLHWRRKPSRDLG